MYAFSSSCRYCSMVVICKSKKEGWYWCIFVHLLLNIISYWICSDLYKMFSLTRLGRFCSSSAYAPICCTTCHYPSCSYRTCGCSKDDAIQGCELLCCCALAMAFGGPRLDGSPSFWFCFISSAIALSLESMLDVWYWIWWDQIWVWSVWCVGSVDCVVLAILRVGDMIWVEWCRIVVLGWSSSCVIKLKVIVIDDAEEYTSWFLFISLY